MSTTPIQAFRSVDQINLDIAINKKAFEDTKALYEAAYREYYEAYDKHFEAAYPACLQVELTDLSTMTYAPEAAEKVAEYASFAKSDAIKMTEAADAMVSCITSGHGAMADYEQAMGVAKAAFDELETVVRRLGNALEKAEHDYKVAELDASTAAHKAVDAIMLPLGLLSTREALKNKKADLHDERYALHTELSDARLRYTAALNRHVAAQKATPTLSRAPKEWDEVAERELPEYDQYKDNGVDRSDFV